VTFFITRVDGIEGQALRSTPDHLMV
jgi:hypothetical protein